jgi:hypothetical protein
MAERWTASRNPLVLAAVIVAIIVLVAYKTRQRYFARQATSPPAPATATP